jgi:hypothetical protein
MMLVGQLYKKGLAWAKKKKALRFSPKGLAGRPKRSIIEPDLSGFERFSRVFEREFIAIQQGSVSSKVARFS